MPDHDLASAPPSAATHTRFECAEVWSSAGPWRHALVMPSPTLALPLQVRRRLQRAVLQLADGPCWHISGQGLQLDEQTLDRIATELNEHARSGTSPADVADHVRERLELAVDMRPIRIDDFDSAAWPIRQLAVDVLVRTAVNAKRRQSGATASPTSQALEDLVAQMAQDLQRKLDRLRADAIDEEVERVAGRFGANSWHVYAYLSDQQHRRYRLQAAETAGLFVPCTASGSPVFNSVRHAIDEGWSLNEAVGKLCGGVSPSTLRIVMSSRCASACMERWSGDPVALARLVDRIHPPELRPRTDHDWQVFSGLVNAFERAAQSGIERGVFGTLWLVARLRGQRRQQRNLALTSSSRADADPSPEVDLDSLRQVDGLRRMLIGVLAAELGHREQQQRSSWLSVVEHVVDTTMCRGGMRYWIRIARSAHEALSRKRSDNDVAAMASDMVSGERTWPLTSSPFVNRDGGTITTLRNEAELKTHGEHMDICLAESHLQRYVRACKSGRHFVVALRDAAGQPCSTAELGLSSQPIDGHWRISVHQHTGHGNADPSPRCRLALQEFVIHLATADVQRHIGIGVRIWQGFQGRAATRQSAAELLRHLQAINQALGPAIYSALRASCAASLRERSLPVSLKALLPQ